VGCLESCWWQLPTIIVSQSFALATRKEQKKTNKKKKTGPSWVHVEWSHCLHEICIPEMVGYHFWAGLINPLPKSMGSLVLVGAKDQPWMELIIIIPRLLKRVFHTQSCTSCTQFDIFLHYLQACKAIHCASLGDPKTLLWLKLT
jgi:hypothetical protein